MVQQTEQCIDESIEAPTEEMIEMVVDRNIEEFRLEVQPKDSATNLNPEEIRYATTEDV